MVPVHGDGTRPTSEVPIFQPLDVPKMMAPGVVTFQGVHVLLRDLTLSPEWVKTS